MAPPPVVGPMWHERRRRLAHYAGLMQMVAGLAFLTGLWLIASPWILGQQRAAVPTWDQVAVGSLLGVLAALRLAAPIRLERLWFGEFSLGLWTICAGFLLTYPADFDRVPMLWNHILTGAVVLGLAGFSAAAGDSYIAPYRGAAALASTRSRTAGTAPRT